MYDITSSTIGSYFTILRDNINNIFNRLGIGLYKTVCLTNMTVNPSRLDSSKSGSCTFDYLLGKEGNVLDGDTVTYYLGNELFTDGESYANDFGVKLTSGNESLFYSVSDKTVIRKYSISLAKDWTLIREFSRDEVLFIFEGLNNRLVIRIKKNSVGGRDTSCQLDNETMVLDYLRMLTSEYDVLDVYSKLCELSLGDDVSVYPEITVSDLRKVNGNWKDVNLISVKNGEVDFAVRTIGDKKNKLFGNGNWSYVLSNDGVKFVFEHGKEFELMVMTEDSASMNACIDSGILKNGLSAAIKEVDEVSQLVRTKCKLGNKN